MNKLILSIVYIQNKEKMNKKDGKYKQKELIGCFETIGLFGNDFRELRIKQVRKYVRAITHSDPQKNIPKCLKLLKDQAKAIQQLQKILIFCHILIQEGENLNSDTKDFIVDEINETLSTAQAIVKKKKQNSERSGVFSVEKTFNWIKDRISTSKQKKQIRPRKNSDFSQEKQNLSVSKGNQTPKNNTSKQQFLFYNLVVPYASFLLKIINNKTISSATQIMKIQKSEIWKEINVFKSLVKVSNVIALVLRYYMQEYLQLIISLIKVFDFDIKMRYPVIDGFLRNSYREIQEQYKGILAKKLSENKQIQAFEQIIHNFQIPQIKNIIDQIAEINEGILQIYYGRYHFNRLQIQGISCVKLMKTSTEFDLVFSILKVQQKKQKSMEKSMRRDQMSRLQMTSSLMLGKQKMLNNRKSLKLVLDRAKNSHVKEEQVDEPDTPVKKPLNTPSTEGRTTELTEHDMAKDESKQSQIGNRFKLLRQNTTQEQQHHKRNRLKL